MNFALKKSDLNFKVYTVEARPTAPGAENDIAIISSVPMTNWLMSPENPSGTPRTDGDVWIQYSTNGDTFNALKQNTLMIATISAWQYVDGTWVTRDAVSCQGGEWVDWIIYLYNKGDECEQITGGWQARGFPNNSAFTGVAPTVTKNSKGVTLTLSSSKNVSGVFEVKNDIDLTPYNKLVGVFPLVKAVGTISGGGWGVNLMVIPRNETQTDGREIVLANKGKDRGVAEYENVTLEVPLVGVNNSYDIVVHLYTWGGNVTVTCELESVRLYFE